MGCDGGPEVGQPLQRQDGHKAAFNLHLAVEELGSHIKRNLLTDTE